MNLQTGPMKNGFKFGAHQFLWTGRWTDESLPLLDHVRELGLELMEISLGDEIAFAPSPVREHAAKIGLELTVGPGNEWPMECDISSDDTVQRQLGLAWHRKILQRAAELGAAAYCGAIYGHPGRVLRRRPPRDEFERTAENLRALAEHGAKLGVRLVIEPMSRFRSHIANTSAQAVALADAAGHPNLFVNLDTYHMITEERDYAAAIRTAGAKLWGLHACENDRGVPGGGLVPWPQVMAALGEIRPDARVMFETYNTSGDFGFARGIFQNVCPDPDAFVLRGLNFLRDLQ